jgi:hypothetical protein
VVEITFCASNMAFRGPLSNLNSSIAFSILSDHRGL